MAKIIRNIEDIKNIQEKDFIIEIENLELIDDSGNSVIFNIGGITPVSAEMCAKLDNNVDWNKNNFHFIVNHTQKTLGGL